MKVLADQLVFSSLYTVFFFMSIGCMTGTIEKWRADAKKHGLEEAHAILESVRCAALSAPRGAAAVAVLALHGIAHRIRRSRPRRRRRGRPRCGAALSRAAARAARVRVSAAGAG